MVEALELGVPVISTDLPVLSEIGLKDRINGYIIPLDINSLSDDWLSYILSHKPKFDYSRKADNERIIKQWQKVLGNTTPKEKESALQVVSGAWLLRISTIKRWAVQLRPETM